MQLPDAIDRIRRSVVQIHRYGAGRDGYSTLGTGFVVTPSAHVVTAKHVVDAVDYAAGETVAVAFANPDVDEPGIKIRATFAGTDARVIDTVPEHDLALLEVPGGRVLRRRRSGSAISRLSPIVSRSTFQHLTCVRELL